MRSLSVLSSVILGSSAHSGNETFAIAVLTLFTNESVSVSFSSSIVVFEKLLLLTDEYFLMPSRSSIACSISSVISVSISTGFAQTYNVLIWTIPNFICGLLSFGIDCRERNHNQKIKSINKKLTLQYLIRNQKKLFSRCCIRGCVFIDDNVLVK